MREYKLQEESKLERREPSARRTVEVEESLEQLSRWMDGVFRIPGVGWRFGLDALIGFIPALGDTASSLVSFYILAAGVRYRVPKVTLLRMGMNIGIDYLVGAVPVLGDAFDFVWKANQKNVELLRQRATVSAEEAKKGRASDWLFVGVIILILLCLLFGSIALGLYLLTLLFNQLSSLF